jgi:hypothetical protein
MDSMEHTQILQSLGAIDHGLSHVFKRMEQPALLINPSFARMRKSSIMAFPLDSRIRGNDAADGNDFMTKVEPQDAP